MRFETIDKSCDVVLHGYLERAGLHQKLHYDERNSVNKFGWEAHEEIPKLPLKNELSSLQEFNELYFRF